LQKNGQKAKKHQTLIFFLWPVAVPQLVKQLTHDPEFLGLNPAATEIRCKRQIFLYESIAILLLIEQSTHYPISKVLNPAPAAKG
jgi:hypothetical protein